VKKAVIVTDLGYGDAGKGSTVDYLVRQAESAVVVRHNGGAQAAHNVVTPEGLHHTFAQFGSGSFVPGVRTHLSRFMLVNPPNMLNEAAHLIALGITDIWQRTTVDAAAPVITPWHRDANRLRELARGDRRHGSCGQGIGEVMADMERDPGSVLRVGDLLQPGLVDRLRVIRRAKYMQLLHDVPYRPQDQLHWESFADHQYVRATMQLYREWADKVTIVDGAFLQTLGDQHEQLVFEGAQGVLLDEWHGFHPYTTWSTTTPANALTLLGEIKYDAPVTRLGVLRAYSTRHGPGPFVTHCENTQRLLPERHNGHGQWQGAFRIGPLDLVALHYGLDASGGQDELMVTCLDRVAWLPDVRYCSSYESPCYSSGAADDFQFAPGDYTAIVRIHARPTVRDLERQARLTAQLQLCSPIYFNAQPPMGVLEEEDRVAALLKVIEDRLGVPITLASYGPTADDKRVLVAR